MNLEIRRFACTQCGKCCNRSPELELSEVAALSDVFVFRLMFRLYWLADAPHSANSNAAFFERKRLLSAFAARKYPVKVRRDGKRLAYTKHLVISALALDAVPGACAALRGTLCGIHDRRPMSCRSVPLHYSRPEALAVSDLEAFVATPGYECDTSDTAEVLVERGRIVDPAVRAARAGAIAIAKNDRRWSQTIVRRMNDASSRDPSLPSLTQIEVNAQLGATTTSMRVAWQIAADAALIDQAECDRLVEAQLGTIRSELAGGRCSPEAIETLREMELEYLQHRAGGHGISSGS